MRYSRPIRLLHALIALTITFQLLVSLVMDHPHAKRPMTETGAFYFRWHEWIGVAAFAVLTLGWIYRIVKWQRESQGSLFPWTTSANRQALAAQTKQFLLLRWGQIPQDGVLVGAVHGLGLLVASAMALTGVVIYEMLGPQNSVTPEVHRVMELHSFLANLMWAYFIGHIAMACWHQYMGHGALARIFKL